MPWGKTGTYTLPAKRIAPNKQAGAGTKELLLEEVKITVGAGGYGGPFRGTYYRGNPVGTFDTVQSYSGRKHG